MLSDSDLRKEFGKHIGLFPFESKNVEGGSIYLTASRYAWSREMHTPIVQNDIIRIEKGDTAIILTAESISLDETVSGVCLARVSHPVKGLLSSSTPIKPGWTGRLLISLYNSSNLPIEISVGEPIAVIMLSKLKKPASSNDNKGGGGRMDLLASLGIQISDEFRSEFNDKQYNGKNDLIIAMEETKSYQDFKKKRRRGRRADALWYVIVFLGIMSGLEFIYLAYLQMSKLPVDFAGVIFTATTSALVALWAKRGN